MSDRQRYCTDPLLFIDDAGHPTEVRCERLIVDRFGNPTHPPHKNHERHHDDIPGVEAVTTWKRRP